VKSGFSALLVLCLAFAPAGAAAQRSVSPRVAHAGTDVSVSGSASGRVTVESDAFPGRSPLRIGGIRPIAVAKWGALLGAAGAAAYGFIRNGEADDLFRALELACNANRAVCGVRTPDGAYADAALESMYQDVLAHDRTSQRALLASQVGVAVGVVLFLIDLRADDRPADIPYEPRRIDVAPARGGGISLSARLTVPFRAP
jgi:hypothetical protein